MIRRLLQCFVCHDIAISGDIMKLCASCGKLGTMIQIGSAEIDSASSSRVDALYKKWLEDGAGVPPQECEMCKSEEEHTEDQTVYRNDGLTYCKRSGERLYTEDGDNDSEEEETIASFDPGEDS